MRNSWTLTQKCSAIDGHDFAKTSPLKNVFWTADQPGALTTSQPRATNTTTVLARAIAVERSASSLRAWTGPGRDAGADPRDG